MFNLIKIFTIVNDKIEDGTCTTLLVQRYNNNSNKLLAKTKKKLLKLSINSQCNINI